MHCIEVKAGTFNLFKSEASKLGVEVTVVSRYTDRGIRLMDVEVSRDTRAIARLEQRFSYQG